MNNPKSAAIEPAGVMTDAEHDQCIAELLKPVPITTGAGAPDAAGNESYYETEVTMGDARYGVFRAGPNVEVEWISLECLNGKNGGREVWVARDPEDSELGAVLVVDHVIYGAEGEKTLARQFNMVEFDDEMRDGDAIELAIEAVRRVHDEVAEDAVRRMLVGETK